MMFKEIMDDVKRQASMLMPMMLLVYLPALVLLAGLVATRVFFNIPFGDLTRDPMAIVSAPPYTGILSSFGSALWAGAIGLCTLSASKSRAERRRLFWCLAALTSILFLDDLIMIHELIAPETLGLPEYVAFALYGLFLLIILVRFRTQILLTEYFLMFLALLFFASSLAFDMLPTEIPAQYLVEDGLKFFGILTWATFFFREALKDKEAASPS